MQRRLLLDVVVAQCTPIFELLSGEDQALLVGRNTFFVLDFALDIVDCVAGLDFEGDGFAREGLHETLGRVSVIASLWDASGGGSVVGRTSALRGC